MILVVGQGKETTGEAGRRLRIGVCVDLVSWWRLHHLNDLLLRHLYVLLEAFESDKDD